MITVIVTAAEMHRVLDVNLAVAQSRAVSGKDCMCDSNCVTPVQNKYAICESNRIEKKQVSLVKPKPQLSPIKLNPN